MFNLFTLQAESPSSNQLSALAIYLLTCLFFVGCAIVEFAYLLQRRRGAERRFNYQKIKQNRANGEPLEEVVLKNDESIKENMKRDCIKSGIIPPQFTDLDATMTDKQQFWMKSNLIVFKCCTLNIDILSQWIFLIMFILFNICYWLYYLKLYQRLM